MTPPTPSLPKRVLAIAAHPDDIELQCAGTLARFAANGSTVIMAIATDGSAGHRTIPPKELVEIRHSEAARSTAILGAELHWLGFTDELLSEDMTTRLRFVELIRAANPDIILTHSPADYHPDHRTVYRLAFDASFVASLPNVPMEHAATTSTAALLHFDHFAGVNFVPEEYVDITDAYEIKKAMLACHQSQMKLARSRDEITLLDVMDVQARMRGLACGVPYAEGFRLEQSFPRLRAERLLP
jgi:LmbE family N-acetylglucosaminyl deacetylase